MNYNWKDINTKQKELYLNDARYMIDFNLLDNVFSKQMIWPTISIKETTSTYLYVKEQNSTSSKS